MNRKLSFFATGIFLQVASSAAQAQVPNAGQTLDLIIHTAEGICGVIEANGSVTTSTVQGSVSAELKGLASRLAGAGVQGTGNITSEGWQGPMREELGTTIRDIAACKLKVLGSLTQILLAAPPPPPSVFWFPTGYSTIGWVGHDTAHTNGEFPRYLSAQKNVLCDRDHVNNVALCWDDHPSGRAPGILDTDVPNDPSHPVRKWCTYKNRDVRANSPPGGSAPPAVLYICSSPVPQQ